MPARMSELSDPELVSALAAGELDAMDFLYRRYSTLAYSLALRILATPAGPRTLSRMPS